MLCDRAPLFPATRAVGGLAPHPRGAVSGRLFGQPTEFRSAPFGRRVLLGPISGNRGLVRDCFASAGVCRGCGLGIGWTELSRPDCQIAAIAGQRRSLATAASLVSSERTKCVRPKLGHERGRYPDTDVPAFRSPLEILAVRHPGTSLVIARA